MTNVESSAIENRRPAEKGGLDGVVVADTRLSDVDGERGRLVIAGHDIEQLASWASFEDMVDLLERAVPGGDASAAASSVAADLGRGRVLAFELLPRLGDALRADDGMDALRAGVAQLQSAAGIAAERATLASLSVFAAAWMRMRMGHEPVAPDATLSHATDYLRMATGGNVDPARARALDTYLVTVADHGMNASTFTARVIASTASDVVSAITGALGALKGPLHGGAPGPVLDMLDAIRTPERAHEWLSDHIARGERIMGMGHRIYRARDPRAAVFETAIGALGNDTSAKARLALAREVEKAAEALLRERHPDRPLKANVEFYTAILLEAVGLPRDAFTPTFAVGRVAGWLAHVREQRAFGRLVRPASQYIGSHPGPSGAPLVAHG